MSNNIRDRINNKKGVAVFIALFMMVFLGILILQFHFRSSTANNTVHRFHTSEMARQLAAAAQDEAFHYISNQTYNIYDNTFTNLNPLPKKIIERTMDEGIKLDIPATMEMAEDLLPGRLDISATAKIIDFRNEDAKGNQFYGNEGIGTLEIAVRVKAKKKYAKMFPGSCTMIRHHDYKVISILSKVENGEQRSGYVENSLLDYVLFVRKGQEEFEKYGIAASSINPANTSLVIDSGNALGKVNFGSGPNNYQYLNLSKKTEDFIHTAKTPTEIVGLGGDGGNAEEIANKIYPDFITTLAKEAKDEGGTLEALKGHKLKFFYQRLPLTNEYYTNEDLKNARYTATINAVQQNKVVPVDYEGNPVFYEGIKIQPEDKLEEIIDSDLRMRFLNIGYFYLDLTNCEVSVHVKKKGTKTLNVKSYRPKLIDQYKDNKVYCYDYTYHSAYQKNPNNDLFKNVINMVELKKHLQSQGRESEAFTYINEDYAYTKSESEPIRKTTAFYNKSSELRNSPAETAYPFAHYNLWNKRDLMVNDSTNDLENLEIFNKESNTLYLRGVVECLSPITLGDPKLELVIDGCGVLIAPGITIEGPIKKKNPNSVCVLFARDGSITINTKEQIEAALMAMGKNSQSSRITCNEALDLKGSIATDFLNLSQWKSNVTHKITYDEALAPKKDIYQINLSSWASFERVVENE